MFETGGEGTLGTVMLFAGLLLPALLRKEVLPLVRLPCIELLLAALEFTGRFRVEGVVLKDELLLTGLLYIVVELLGLELLLFIC
jgi:hypothetical protein